jgi:hypothetical protein
VLARKYGISIVVIHHTRKAGSEDPLDLISGSFGLTGAADGALILNRSRGQVDAVLHSTGRDFEEQELALRWDAAIYGWKIIGDAEELCLSRERKEIIDLIRFDGAKTPKEVAELLNRNQSATRKLMPAMACDGQLVNDGAGCYSLPLNTNNGNYSNSSNSTHYGNLGNSDFKSANGQQSYLQFQPGNSANCSYNKDLNKKVTTVTAVTFVENDKLFDDEARERAAIMEFDGKIPREEAEDLASANSEAFLTISVEDLLGSEEGSTHAA